MPRNLVILTASRNNGDKLESEICFVLSEKFPVVVQATSSSLPQRWLKAIYGWATPFDTMSFISPVSPGLTSSSLVGIGKSVGSLALEPFIGRAQSG